ncbi:MAG: iron ABC transporter permease [Candidatus Cloacimonadota bacterium]|nr:iron ABC transporter permease [Candidatus Cloacimonadota bacterium]
MKNKTAITISLISLIAIIIFSLLIGSVKVNIFSISEIGKNILFNIRIPRILLGLIAGMVLATSGGILQGMLNNPLAEPYLLGISSGAALGSIVALVIQKVFLMPVLGFMGALLTMFLVWHLAKSKNSIQRTKLILAGIIINLFFSAIIALLMSIFQRDISQIFSILMGNLGYIFSRDNIHILWIISIVSVGGIVFINLYSNRLNILTMGDYTANSLGVDVQKTRKLLFVLSSVLVGIVVAFTGIIGFVGLIIPHICRMIIGPNNRYLLPMSGILGAAFLLLCDTIARSLFVIELPVGVVTALCGAPFFIYLLRKK